ncbi:MAG: flagellar biosynthesis protein FlhA [Fimbriimonadia bacterium]|jgi:flagellar biosynthesis protein FlhA
MATAVVTGVGLNRLLRNTDVIVALGIMVVVGMLVLPLPEWLLDTGFVISLGSAVMIAIMSASVTDPLQFASFPSLLLMSTLLRLALSIAATKLILGSASAGRIIEAFGNFLVGGDMVVGLVAFVILVIVQFVVITNGAGRVAEVVARFTLDAMPGKQMSIDADLNAGLIDENEARERRKQVKQEADFYGAMDGASKFVKGDAIAAILILIVNIVGGFGVGFLRGENDAMTILRTYTLLTVGEGLVAQIPALLVSTAAGLMVTRSGATDSLGTALFSQILAQPRSLMAATGALILLALVPGFPKVPFLAVALVTGILAYWVRPQKQKVAPAPQQTPEKTSTGPEAMLSLVSVDPIELELGYAITRLADPREHGDLADRVSVIRRQIAAELGFVMPSVRIRDNIQLPPNDYVIRIRGERVAGGTAFANQVLAIESGDVTGQVPGSPATEPVFGLPARWIEAGLREQAERSGYTVVDPGGMIATHLTEVVKTHAGELLSRQDVQMLIDHVRRQTPAVVEELIPDVLSLGDVQKVLAHLLRERVPIRDTVTILETLADYGARIKDPEQLGELVRAALSRVITRLYQDEHNTIHVITLDPQVEQMLKESVQQTTFGQMLALDPQVAESLLSHLEKQAENAAVSGNTPVLLCSSSIRLPLRKLVERSIPSLAVVAYNEIVPRTEVNPVGRVAA